jgi:type IV pilus assembly protein PilF
MKKLWLTATVGSLALTLISCAPKNSAINRDDAIQIVKPDYAAAAQTNIEIGLVMFKRGETEAAKESFLRAIQQNPKSSESWYAMAYFYEFTGNSVEAAKDYRKAIALAPRASAGAARNNYGAFLCREKHYQEGLKQILQAAESSNYVNTAEAYENAGLCAQRIPDRKNAIAYFQKALANDPNRRASLISLSKLYSKIGNKKLADYYMAKYYRATS